MITGSGGGHSLLWQNLLQISNDLFDVSRLQLVLTESEVRSYFALIVKHNREVGILGNVVTTMTSRIVRGQDDLLEISLLGHFLKFHFE